MGTHGDDRLDCHPAHLHDGNGRDRYVDMEAARCLETPTGGIGPLLDEAWQRYRLPMAITEAHIDSTRDDQLRWLIEIWRAGVAARERGWSTRCCVI